MSEAMRSAGIAPLAGLALLALAGCGGSAPLEQPLPYFRPNPDAVAAPGLYQIPPGATPDGTFRASIARGAGAARGTLLTNTLQFPITLQGLSAPGATGRVEVTGQVFGLGRTDQVTGTYKPVGDTAAAGGDAAGGLQLGNDNLVVIRLRPARAGQALSVPPEGMTVTLQR
jgi:predicted small lipoprotein YifL